ncbi:hypothetical protein UlMin_040873 [Ulmus minor]
MHYTKHKPLYLPSNSIKTLKFVDQTHLQMARLGFFFFFLVVGIHLREAPFLHPMSEGLFNFFIGWRFMFATLLFTDRKRDRYKGSLDVFIIFLHVASPAFLIPYIAIRLNEAGSDYDQTNAPVVGISSGVVCLISVLWALFGRIWMAISGEADIWEFLVSYLGSERLAYAFIWDIYLYIVFQPWLIGDTTFKMLGKFVEET